jgi:lipoprotein-releasing system permease protein
MIFLAIRYLLARKKQTTFTLLGIFFGTLSHIVLSGFILGFRAYLVEQMVNNNAHVRIQAREDFLTDHSLDESFFGKSLKIAVWDTPPSGRKSSAFIANPQSWYKLLDSEKMVSAYTPQLSASVLLSSGTASVTSNMIGCNPVQQRVVTTIGDNITEGSFSDLAAGGNRLVIGVEVKKKLGVRLGQNIMVSTSKSLPKPFKVAGVFQTGIKMGDNIVYGEIGDVQAINKTPNRVNEIAVKLTDHQESARLATIWSTLGEENVESWDQTNASLLDAFKFQDAVRFMTIGAILLVAGFGIYNVLNMTVMQKRRDIAILQSMGYGSRQIVFLFFSQGLILGVVGAVFGMIFGYFALCFIETIPFGGNPMLGNISHLLVSKSPSLFIQAACFALAASTLASILPARTAGKLMPIEIIRAGTE